MHAEDYRTRCKVSEFDIDDEVADFLKRGLTDHVDHRRVQGLKVVGNKVTIYSFGNESGSRSELGIRPRVPSAAETIISYICTADRLEAILGDLQRNFLRRAVKHGETAAQRWYWWQTIRTVAAFGVQIGVKLAMVRELLEKLGL